MVPADDTRDSQMERKRHVQDLRVQIKTQVTMFECSNRLCSNRRILENNPINQIVCLHVKPAKIGQFGNLLKLKLSNFILNQNRNLLTNQFLPKNL